jgi:hypothetical protein
MTPRLRRLLARPDAWIEALPSGYGVRCRADRRARLLAVLTEAEFRELVERPGLRLRPGGGWTPRHRPRAPEPPPPGRPGAVEGERPLIDADGEVTLVRANMTGSAVTWLAARRDADGRPFLVPAEVAAAERLSFDAETALRGPSLTMRWDALPRARGGSAARAEPGDRALAAARRVEAALVACGPARAMVEHICIRASALQAAEHDLGLRRREGKALLRSGLQALAVHYRIG